MTTYLKLCQRLRSEADVPGTGPTTVIGQTGELLKLIQWLDAAYEDVQNYHPNWTFLEDSISFSTVVGQSVYTPTEAGVTDILTLRYDDLRIYSLVGDEQFLFYEPWDEFRPEYQFASRRTQTGKPTIVTMKPNKSVELWPLPDQIYTFDGQYYKKPDIMTADDDEPIMPSNFHLVIVWRALMLYGASEGAPDVYAHGKTEYSKLMRKLEIDQIPDMVYGEPLA